MSGIPLPMPASAGVNRNPFAPPYGEGNTRQANDSPQVPQALSTGDRALRALNVGANGAAVTVIPLMAGATAIGAGAGVFAELMTRVDYPRFAEPLSRAAATGLRDTLRETTPFIAIAGGAVAAGAVTTSLSGSKRAGLAVGISTAGLATALVTRRLGPALAMAGAGLVAGVAGAYLGDQQVTLQQSGKAVVAGAKTAGEIASSMAHLPIDIVRTLKAYASD